MLTSPPRLQILAILRASRQGMTQVQVREELGYLSQPTMSHHLSKLMRAGLITRTAMDPKSATRTYAIVPRSLAWVAKAIRGLS